MLRINIHCNSDVKNKHTLQLDLPVRLRYTSFVSVKQFHVKDSALYTSEKCELSLLVIAD